MNYPTGRVIEVQVARASAGVMYDHGGAFLVYACGCGALTRGARTQDAQHARHIYSLLQLSRQQQEAAAEFWERWRDIGGISEAVGPTTFTGLECAAAEVFLPPTASAARVGQEMPPQPDHLAGRINLIHRAALPGEVLSAAQVAAAWWSAMRRGRPAVDWLQLFRCAVEDQAAAPDDAPHAAPNAESMDGDVAAACMP